MIAAQAHEDANIIWGAAFDEDMTDEMSVTVIATGFTSRETNVSLPGDRPASAPAGGRPANGAAGSRRPLLARRTGKNHAGPSVDEDDTFYDIMSIFNRK